VAAAPPLTRPVLVKDIQSSLVVNPNLSLLSLVSARRRTTLVGESDATIRGSLPIPARSWGRRHPRGAGLWARPAHDLLSATRPLL